MEFEKLHTELILSTSRSGGSGGQHVNKVETKVTLRFAVMESQHLSDIQKAKIIARLKTYISNKKELILHNETERSQLKNKQKIIKKFDDLIKLALKERKKRKPTKASKQVRLKRVLKKKHRSETKASRRKILL